MDCFIPNFKLKYEDSENVKADPVNTVLFNLHQNKRQAFSWDIRYVGYMILDTGCLHNVAGKIWVDCLLECLSDEELKLVEISLSTTKFKFGGDSVLQSLYKIQVPILVAGCHVTISFDVVESDIDSPIAWEEDNEELASGY